MADDDAFMFEFCAQEQCTLDSAGRVKLSAGILRDFERHTKEQVVLYCLPEGALGLYPPKIWLELRDKLLASQVPYTENLVTRRTRRRFGSQSMPTSITNQGRITVPPLYREHAGLTPGEPLMLVGCEVGVELWNLDRWRVEAGLIQTHAQAKGEQQMEHDLRRDEQ